MRGGKLSNNYWPATKATTKFAPFCRCSYASRRGRGSHGRRSALSLHSSSSSIRLSSIVASTPSITTSLVRFQVVKLKIKEISLRLAGLAWKPKLILRAIFPYTYNRRLVGLSVSLFRGEVAVTYIFPIVTYNACHRVPVAKPPGSSLLRSARSRDTVIVSYSISR